ncbi:MAG: ATP-dependent exoDNAse (exonuclease V) beta subunit, partial [Myxococcota bacterium]
ARWERARGRKLVQAASSAELALDDDLDEDTEAQPEPGAADGAAEPDDLRAAAARELGIEVHALLEVWDGVDAPDLSEATAEAAEMVRTFLQTPLSQRVRSARQAFRELPFLGPGSVGIVDLLLETEDGWLVVDYKTNAVSSESEARAAAEAYRGQAHAYVAAVRGALQTSNVRFEAWFLRGPWAVAL